MFVFAFDPNTLGFSNGLVGREFACHAGDTGDAGLIPGLGTSPGEGSGKLLQYPCLKNPMGRGAWWVPKTKNTHTHRYFKKNSNARVTYFFAIVCSFLSLTHK